MDTIDQAISYHQRGELDHACDIYRAVLSKNPKNVDALHLFGLAQYQMGRAKDAIQYLKKAVKLQPKFIEAHINLGNAYKSINDNDKACQSYKNAIARGAKLPALFFNYGQVLASQSKHNLARDQFDIALKMKPDYIEAFNDAGISSLHLNQLDKAINYFHKALDIQSTNIPVIINLVKTYIQSNDLRPAIALIESVPDADMPLEIVMLHSMVLRNLEKPTEALDVVTTAQKKYPDDVSLHSEIGVILLALDDVEGAIDKFQYCINIDNSYVPAYILLAFQYYLIKQTNKALELYERVLLMNPYNADALVGYAEAINDEQRVAAASKLADALPYIQHDNDISKVLFALADLHEKNRNYKEAFKFYKRANDKKNTYNQYDLADEKEKINAIKSNLIQSFRPDYSKDDYPRPIFILGMPRSGSTLVEQILASHPDVYGAGEVEYLKTAAIERFNEKHYVQLFTQIGQAQASDLEAVALDYLVHIREKANGEFFVTDKLPSNYYFINLIKQVMPQAVIIHTTRNPMATGFSIYKHNFKAPHPYAYNLKNIGHHYQEYQNLMAYWSELYGDGILDLSYEHLIEDFEPTVRQLLAYCGLSWDERCLAFNKTKRRVLTASANQVNQPLYRSGLDFWENYADNLKPLVAILNQ